MLPSKASITPRTLLLFMDIRSPGFSKLFRNKSNAFGTIPPDKKMRVVYTLVEQPDGTTVVVITAFED